MQYEVDIRVVTTIATILVAVTVAAVLQSLRRTEDSKERACFANLAYAGLSFGTVSVFLLAGQKLPFWVSTSGIVTGAHFGLIFAFLFVRRLVGAPADARRAIRFGLSACVAQLGLALVADSVVLIVISSSLVNGAAGAYMAVSSARAALGMGRAMALVLSVPFGAIAFFYVARLPVAFFWSDPAVLTTISASLSLVIGISIVQWGLGSFLARALQLNSLLRQARDEAEALARQRREFLFHMSHEIRTPLNGIVGTLDLAETERDPEAVRAMIRDMIASGAHLTRTLNDLLDHARLEAKGVVLEDIAFDVRELGRTVEGTFASPCAAKGVRLVTRISEAAAGGWRGDPHKISQIIFNLVGNAVKFTETGAVRLSFEVGGDGGLVIQVRDSGVGMDAAQIDRLFEEFVQAEVSTLRRFGGTGLGMSITKKLIDAMGGDVAIESAVGEGTTFRVTLPLARAELRVAEAAAPAPVPTPAPEPEAARGGGAARLRVLVADDSALNRKIMGQMLSRLDCSAVSVEDGGRAVEMAATGEFDLYIFDISMPVLTGVEALAAIRRAEAAAGLDPVPAIASTANSSEVCGTGYVEIGFTHHLLKPVRLEKLKGFVASVRANLADPPLRRAR